jgi:hypothetical protein
MLFDSLICILSVIMLLFGILSHLKRISVVSIIVLCVGLLLSIFCDKYFNWYIGCTYDLSKRNKLIYTFNLNGISVSQNKTIITISDVKKFKIKGDKLKVTGHIEKKSPMRAAIILNRITLQFDFDDDAKTAILDKLNQIKI